MMQIKTLPSIQNAKFIVIDEDAEAIHATNLIAGWLQMWKSTCNSQCVDLLLFSDPKATFDHWLEKFGEQHVKIHDYYTQNIHDMDNNKQTIDLDSIMKALGKSTNGEVSKIVVVNCLSTLILSIGLARAMRLITQLSNQVSQLICIYPRDFILNPVPCIETLGTTYVQLDKTNLTNLENDICYEVKVTHRKQGGSIVKNHVLISQDISTYEIKSEKKPITKMTETVQSVKSKSVLKPQATFRLDMNQRELDQRNMTPLPYTPDSQSKIFYVPDEMDDLDEEDPDDDLPF